jgi:PiT family inorganic phosphate transporter
MGFGACAIRWKVAATILILLGIGPWLAAALSFSFALALRWMGQWLFPTVSGFLHTVHGAVSGGLALAHGSMDGQKSLAILWLAMAAFSARPPGIQAIAPFLCAGGLTLGVILGSHRTMRTLGRGLYPMLGHQGLCAETAAMVVVGGSSLVGWPMATSHAMSSAVLGAGAAVHPKGIRWGTASEIALAWIFTIPAAGLLAALLFGLLQRGFHVVS